MTKAQGKGKAKTFTPERRDPGPDRFTFNRPRRDFFNQAPQKPPQARNLVFKENIYRVLEKIKKKKRAICKWLNMMGGDSTK